MTSEMTGLVEAFDYGWDDLRWFTINAMKSAFLPFDERLAIIDERDQARLRRAQRVVAGGLGQAESSSSQSRVAAKLSTRTDQAATSSSKGGAGAIRSASGLTMALIRLASGVALDSASGGLLVLAGRGGVGQQLDREFQLPAVDGCPDRPAARRPRPSSW